MSRGPGGRVVRVAPASLAWRLGIRPGDELVTVNGEPVRDVIDVRFLLAEERVVLGLWRGREWLEVEGDREYGEEVGLEFESPIFDGVRVCNNGCPFCFLKGLPPGMRPSLYLRDDDYRLSFLNGNFITLTNLVEADWRRIKEQHLSPLYVSVHATEPAVRARCLGAQGLPDVREQLARLGCMGIEVHAQVVLVPGLNDGPHLERTLQDLAEHYPVVRSVSLVPVGLTRYSPAGLRGYFPGEARNLLCHVARWQQGFRRQLGRRWVYASDEWYFLAGRRLPGAAHYEGFPQLENGVGLTRRWLDGWARWANGWEGKEVEGRERAGEGRRCVVLVCGTLIAPVMRRISRELTRLSGTDVRVEAVENRFFGPSVSVSGLLTGADVAEALAGRLGGGCVLLPRAMFGSGGNRTLDEWTVADLEDSLGVPVRVAGEVGELVAAVFEGR
ncbi:MAG: DUF512 domain-containing protein [Anaerolineae bacterium]